MSTRLFFGLVGLIAALLGAWGLEALFALARTPDALQGARVLLFPRFNPAEVSSGAPHGEEAPIGLALLVMTGWGALLGLMLALWLRLPQRRFGVEIEHFVWRAVLGGALGSVVLGAISGLMGQLAFGLLAWLAEPFARIVGLSVLGGLLGYGLHHFVPNLPLNPARMAGTLGGLMGAVGFLGALAHWHDGTGRLLAACLLGLAIGLMITILRKPGRRITPRRLEEIEGIYRLV